MIKKNGYRTPRVKILTDNLNGKSPDLNEPRDVPKKYFESF